MRTHVCSYTYTYKLTDAGTHTHTHNLVYIIHIRIRSNVCIRIPSVDVRAYTSRRTYHNHIRAHIVMLNSCMGAYPYIYAWMYTCLSTHADAPVVCMFTRACVMPFICRHILMRVRTRFIPFIRIRIRWMVLALLWSEVFIHVHIITNMRTRIHNTCIRVRIRSIRVCVYVCVYLYLALYTYV